MKTKGIIILIVVLLVIFGIYLSQKKQDIGNIKIGALYALSGPAAVFGEVSAQGVRDAVKYFEEKNGVKVDLFIEDTANDPKQGVSAATKLFDIDKVKYVVVGTSAITNAVSPIAEKTKSILITDAAGYGLTKGKTFLFQNLLPSLNDVSKQINDKAEWKKVAIVYINDDFGNIWNTEWKKGIASDKLVNSFSFEKTSTDFKTDALKIKTFKPDVVVVVGYGPALNQVFTDLSVQGVNVPYLTYLSCTLPGVVTDKKYDLNGKYSYEYPEYQNIELKNWISKNGGTKDTFYGLAFENTLVALNAELANGDDTVRAIVYLKNNKTSGVYGDIIFDSNNVMQRDLTLTKITNNACVR